MPCFCFISGQNNASKYKNVDPFYNHHQKSPRDLKSNRIPTYPSIFNMKVVCQIVFFCIVSAFAKPQEVVVGDGEPLIESPVEKSEVDIGLRAASTFQNCDCQCDSYSWISNGRYQGNCQR